MTKQMPFDIRFNAKKCFANNIFYQWQPSPSTQPIVKNCTNWNASCDASLHRTQGYPVH